MLLELEKGFKYLVVIVEIYWNVILIWKLINVL